MGMQFFGGENGGENWLDLALPECYYLSMIDDTVSDLRRLPDPKQCRTSRLDYFRHLSKCLVEHPDGCEYVLRFDSGFYCYHPDRHYFEKTNRR